MATIRDLQNRLQQKRKELENFVSDRWPRAVGEMAIKNFKQNFRDSGYNGNNGLEKWKTTKRQQSGSAKAGAMIGPLLSERNQLYGAWSVDVKPRSVTVSNNMSYAPIHNNGGTVSPNVTPRMRKYAWARYFEEMGEAAKASSKRRKKKDDTSQTVTESEEAKKWKGLALTKKTQLNINIPKRQFMGHNHPLDDLVRDYTNTEVLKIFKK